MSNSFGTLFKITTFGESHGKTMGVVIDGCPAGLKIHEEKINEALRLRAPGQSIYTTDRKEEDLAEIVSGVFNGMSTGAPITILIQNKDADSSKYEAVKDVLKPGHANFTYLEKYGIFDHRGGGRASARETACRVAAGAIAESFLENENILLHVYLSKVGMIESNIKEDSFDILKNKTFNSAIYCPDKEASLKMEDLIQNLKTSGDSVGGIVNFLAVNVPSGLGNPIYEKLEAKLALAFLSIPAAKGFEIGSGFESVEMLGSVHNDLYILENESVKTKTNHAGGILGGISTGMPIFGKVAFKPASSIKKSQETLNLKQEKAIFQLPDGSRHDPCVAIRAVFVVKAMLALVLADAVLQNRCAKI